MNKINLGLGKSFGVKFHNKFKMADDADPAASSARNKLYRTIESLPLDLSDKISISLKV